MKALRTATVRVASKGLMEIIPVVQSDSGRSIEFIISDMALPANASAQIYALKPDLTEIYNNCTINGNAVTVDLTTQTLAVVGMVNCQIVIISGDDIVTSFEFALSVEKSLVSNGAIESANEFGALTDAIKQINNLDVGVTGVKGSSEAVYRDGNVNLTPANLGAAPTSHASTGTGYGVGTTANYGHCMTINNLETATHANGKALSAYQGKVLNDKIVFASTPISTQLPAANTTTAGYSAVVLPVKPGYECVSVSAKIDNESSNYFSLYSPINATNGTYVRMRNQGNTAITVKGTLVAMYRKL